MVSAKDVAAASNTSGVMTGVMTGAMTDTTTGTMTRL
jgi:hypothetical protein